MPFASDVPYGAEDQRLRAVIGFAIPDALTESEATTFTDAMSAKHAHYVYFSNRHTLSSFVVYAVESGRGQS